MDMLFDEPESEHTSASEGAEENKVVGRATRRSAQAQIACDSDHFTASEQNKDTLLPDTLKKRGLERMVKLLEDQDVNTMSDFENLDMDDLNECVESDLARSRLPHGRLTQPAPPNHRFFSDLAESKVKLKLGEKGKLRALLRERKVKLLKEDAKLRETLRPFSVQEIPTATSTLEPHHPNPFQPQHPGTPITFEMPRYYPTGPGPFGPGPGVGSAMPRPMGSTDGINGLFDSSGPPQPIAQGPELFMGVPSQDIMTMQHSGAQTHRQQRPAYIRVSRSPASSRVKSARSVTVERERSPRGISRAMRSHVNVGAAQHQMNSPPTRQHSKSLNLSGTKPLKPSRSRTSRQGRSGPVPAPSRVLPPRISKDTMGQSARHLRHQRKRGISSGSTRSLDDSVIDSLFA